MTSAEGFDPYRVLGLARGATDLQVSRAYRSLAKRFHPDLHGSDASRQMRELNRAFRILSDPARRRSWDDAHPVVAWREHWTPSERPAMRDVRRTGPEAWMSWEAGRRPPEAGPDRVRVREGWPRQAAPPEPAARGVRDSAWLAIGVAVLLLGGLLVLGAIAAGGTAGSPRQAIRVLGITPSSEVAIDPDRRLAVYRVGDERLGLVAASRGPGGWRAVVLVEATTAHPFSVLLFTDPDAADLSFASVAFGRAPAGVEQVRLSGLEGRGGDVASGTWAIALPPGTGADDLAWEFVMPDGSVIISGRGELAR